MATVEPADAPPPQRAPVLLERAPELAAIDEVVASARAGTGSTVLFEGDPGLGKSALLAAARAAGSAAAMRLLSAGGGDLESDFSFGVVLQLFEPALAGAGPVQREAVFAGAASLAAPLFDDPRAAAEPVEDEQAFSLFHGLHWLAANLAEQAPLLLVVDDAQWADERSLRFLHYLQQRLDELPIALVVATRPNGAPPQGKLIARLGGHRTTRIQRLAPLGDAAVSALVRARLGGAASDDLCRACASATGGNPFYLHELVGALSAEGVKRGEAAERLAAELGGGSGRHAILARIAGLPDPAPDLAAAIAVLGDGAPLHRAAALAEADGDSAADAADALARAAILAPGPALGFTHPIVRQAVYADLAPTARSHAHARAAGLLAGEGADPERIGSHLVAAGKAAGTWAPAALREAAVLARRRGAPATGVRYLRAAQELDVPGDRAGLLRELALAEAKAGEDTAPERAGAAIDAAAGPVERAGCALELGLALADGGRGEAAAILERGIAELAGDSGELAMTLRAARAGVGGLDGAAEMPGGLPALFERAARGAATSHERLMLAHGALATAFGGASHEEARRLALGALDGAVHDGGTTAEVSVVSLAATALLVVDELSRAEAVLTAAVDGARRHGLVTVFATVSHIRAHARHRLGRMSDAVTDAQSTLEAARYGWQPALPSAHAVLALALIERGELAAAEAALEIEGGAERWEDTFTWSDYLEARGRLRLAQGDARAALEDSLACGGRLEAGGTSHAAIVPWRATAARAALALGDDARAAALADEDVALARRFGAPRALGLTLRTAGLVAGGASGIALLREAVEELERSEGALEHAHALADLGASMLTEGHRVTAREPLRAALDLAHRAGAAPLEERVRADLVAAGARPRRSSASGADALTPRERRLAEMAAAGMSNREIAEALFITKKTVESHLSHVYRKLEIGSRAQLEKALNGD